MEYRVEYRIDENFYQVNILAVSPQELLDVFYRTYGSVEIIFIEKISI